MNKSALEHFKKVDSKLYNIAIKIELEDLKESNNYFLDLIDSIISQQLSGKASATIFSRFKKLFPSELVTPEILIKISDEKIRECGISYSKIKYIKGISHSILNNEINLERLKEKSDEDIIKELIKLNGIGNWTAEMFLMFSLNRSDIFSVGDLGLKNAIIKIYKLNETPTKEKLLEISSRWSPYKTYASRILWKSLEI